MREPHRWVPSCDVEKKAIGIAVVVGLLLLIALSADFDLGAPVVPVSCGELPETSRNVTCFEVPVEGATLAVAVVHAGDTPLEREPLLVLPPLPGETPIADVDLYASSPLAADHDLILVDPRGGGRSAPDVACPDLQADPGALELLQRCREDLTDGGVDLITPGSDATAGDLAEVRRTLSQGRSWSEWDVVGSGYGSQLAQRLARVDDGGVRSLTLSSVVPDQEPSILAGAFAFPQALNGLTALCGQDEGCARHDTAGAAIVRVTDRLDDAAEPLEIPRIGAIDRGEVVSFDGELARTTFARALGEESLVPLLPWAADRLDQAASEFGMGLAGRQTLAAMRAATRRNPAVSQPLFWTLVCSEQIPGIDPGVLSDAVAATPGLIAPIEPSTACDVWNVPQAKPAPLENPIRPATLVLTSSIDPASVRDSADRVAATIDEAVVVEVGVLPRSPLSGGCTSELIATFLADSDSINDVACAGESIRFADRPVPIAGADFASVGDQAASLLALVLGTMLAAVFSAWSLTGPRVAARVAWSVAAALSVVFLLAAGSVLATADSPGRLVAQPAWTWPIFLLPWFIAAAGLTGLTLSGLAVRAGTLRTPWSARHLLVAVGVAAASLGAATAGMIPGA